MAPVCLHAHVCVSTLALMCLSLSVNAHLCVYCMSRLMFVCIFG